MHDDVKELSLKTLRCGERRSSKTPINLHRESELNTHEGNALLCSEREKHLHSVVSSWMQDQLCVGTVSA